MFSPEYKELCIENQEVLREEWKKRGARAGDFVIDREMQKQLVLTSADAETIQLTPLMKRYYIWLSRLDQLLEMLEERGCDWSLCNKDRGYSVFTVPGGLFNGPDPATALLKAYLSLDPVGEVEK